VETLARRGYRFLAPVERIALDEEAPAAAAPAEAKTGFPGRVLAEVRHYFDSFRLF
jgi:DNA-binding winged helix-turn-helix (wHTH) protein